MSRITRIRIPSRYELSADFPTIATADFSLGIGPCGKTVLELDVAFDTAGVIVYQTCPGEEKHFFYPYSQLTGRVEVTHETDLDLDLNAGVPLGFA